MVYILNAKRELEKKPIRVGLNTSAELEIVEGLSEGDSVVIGVLAAGEQPAAATTNPLNPMSNRGPGGGGARGGR